MQSTQVAAVRKPAPQFEAVAWFNGFKKVKLSDYAGKFQESLWVKLWLVLWKVTDTTISMLLFWESHHYHLNTDLTSGSL